MKKCIYLMCLLFMMTSCLRESNESLVIPSGTISSNVVPKEIRDKLEAHIPINEGNFPPTISGFYLEDEVTALFCSDEGNGGFEPGHKFVDKYLYFGPQNKNGLIYDYQGKSKASIEKSDLVQVTGKGDDFTAFYVTNSISDYNDDGIYETSSQVSTVLSGKVSETGFTNFKYAIVMVDKNDPLDKLMEKNVYRVFYESDGLVKRVPDWRGSSAPARRATAAQQENDEQYPAIISANK